MIKEQKEKWIADGGEELQYVFEGIGPNSIVFDIGLYKGNWTREIARRYDPYIYGFEPVSEFYREARKTLAKYPKVQVFNFGLGKDTRKAVIFVNDDASSLIDEGRGKRAGVRIMSVKDVMLDFGRGHVDLASINIEGGEYELLDYMIDTGLVEKFDRLLIQFHQIKVGHRHHRAVIGTRLDLTHEMVYGYDTVWDYWVKRS